MDTLRGKSVFNRLQHTVIIVRSELLLIVSCLIFALCCISFKIQMSPVPILVVSLFVTVAAFLTVHIYWSKFKKGLEAELVYRLPIEKELHDASMVQEKYLPLPEFRDDYSQVSSFYRSASHTSGDFWDYFVLGGKSYFVIADATGHGYSPALISSAIKGCLSALRFKVEATENECLSPEEVVKFANYTVYQCAKSEINMSFFVGVVDFKASILTYSNSSHPSPMILRRRDDETEILKLSKTDNLIGEKPSEEYHQATIPVVAGDVLVLFTDGLTESRSLAGEIYGKKRFQKILSNHSAEATSSLVTQVVSDFLQFNEGKILDDDITFVAAKFLALPQTSKEEPSSIPPL
jgi:sigma-B regulation protein RsbU (phosphoserine phosphatase)